MMKHNFAIILGCLTLLDSCSETVENNTVKDGHECVDLGLSVLWAKYNVSKDTTNITGDYVSFGEFETKENYLPSNYKPDSILGEISATKYDYAAQVWKGGWRTPTFEEYKELFNSCEKHWNDSLKALVFTHKSSDSLVFEANGYKYADSLKHTGESGYYWSSSQNSYYPEYAWRLGFIPTWQELDDGEKYFGYQVRAVIEK